MLRNWLLDEYKLAMARFQEHAHDDCIASMVDDSEISDLYDRLDLREREYLAHYYKCLDEGCSETLADMFAAQAPPQINTDATFLAGKWNQFEDTPHLGDYRRAVAEQHGQMTKGKVYEPQLAAFPGDPEAWIDGRGDIKRVCEKRGWGCEGAVEVAAQNVERLPGRKRKPLAQKLHEAGLPIASD